MSKPAAWYCRPCIQTSYAPSHGYNADCSYPISWQIRKAPILEGVAHSTQITWGVIPSTGPLQTLTRSLLHRARASCHPATRIQTQAPPLRPPIVARWPIHAQKPVAHLSPAVPGVHASCLCQNRNVWLPSPGADHVSFSLSCFDCTTRKHLSDLSDLATAPIDRTGNECLDDTS